MVEGEAVRFPQSPFGEAMENGKERLIVHADSADSADLITAIAQAIRDSIRARVFIRDGETLVEVGPCVNSTALEMHSDCARANSITD